MSETQPSGFNWSLDDFDEIVEYVAEMVGKEFMRTVQIANDIIENPSEYAGIQASITAIKLASHRTKIGVAAQYFKMKSAETKKPHDRLTKDALMVMYTSLEEMINTLKLSARIEKDMIVHG
jgi:hypothetical protein